MPVTMFRKIIGIFMPVSTSNLATPLPPAFFTSSSTMAVTSGCPKGTKPQAAYQTVVLRSKGTVVPLTADIVTGKRRPGAVTKVV